MPDITYVKWSGNEPKEGIVEFSFCLLLLFAIVDLIVIVAGGNQHEESWCRRDHLLLHPQPAQPHQDQLDHVNNAF